MQSLRLSMLHCALCSALAPVLFVSGNAIAGEQPQQVEPVSSELFCDWLHKKPARSKDNQADPAAKADDRRIRIGQIHIRTEPIFVEDADAIWLHHFANWAHVTTRPDTVKRELPFASGEEISVSDLAEAERLLLLAPVSTQIELAREIGGNDGYQTYLVRVEQIKAGQAVGIAQADALKAADIKVIVTGGDVPAGMNSITDVFSAKGGQALGAMLEGLAQTDAGKAVVERATKGAAKPKE